MKPAKSLSLLNAEITACNRCSRLRDYCEEVARVKRRAYLGEDYWGKPVPSLGDPNASLLILGLAPAAHGANRTGRMFTGDSSGDFLFRALWETGFASQPEGRAADDGLQLRDVWISASVHCAPPDNKPLPSEFVACRSFLEQEIALLANLRVVVALGRLAFDQYLSVLLARRVIASRTACLFGHNVAHRLPPPAPVLMASYHPSRQNTSTGKLTAPMLRSVFEHARTILRRVK